MKTIFLDLKHSKNIKPNTKYNDSQIKQKLIWYW